MGRHKIKESQKRKTFNLTFSGDTHANIIPKIKDIADRENTTVSDIIEKFLVQYTRDHGDGNPAYKMTDFVDPHFLATPALMRDKAVISQYLTAIKGTELWPVIDKKLNEWVRIFNLVSKK